MAIQLLQAQTRKGGGSSVARRLRREGWVPGVVYGHNRPTYPVQMQLNALREILLAHPPTLDLEVDGERNRVVIKEIQQDTSTDRLLHVDFQCVARDEKIRVHIPIVLRGTPEGVKAGGVLQQSLRELHVECLPDAIPERVVARIDHLQIDQVLRVKDLELPAGVVAAHDPDLAVLGVHKVIVEEAASPTAAALAEAAAPSQPEVIGEKEREARRLEKEAADAKEGKKKEDKKDEKEKK